MTNISITMPNDPGAQGGSYYISPDCKQILWHLTVYDRSHGGRTRVFARGGPTHETECDDLFLSNIDGTGMRRIGRMTNGFVQSAIAWSPGSDRIALTVGRVIAVVDVR